MDNFLLEWYYKEDERKYALDNSLNIPIGILSALTAGIYYLITKYNYAQESIFFKTAFLILMIVTTVLWSTCIIYILLSYNGITKKNKYTYFYLPSTSIRNIEENKLRPYYENNRTYFEANQITLDMLVQKNVEQILSECINKNINSNDRKAEYLYKSKKSLINCVICLFLAGILFSYNYIKHEKEDIYNIKIIK